MKSFLRFAIALCVGYALYANSISLPDWKRWPLHVREFATSIIASEKQPQQPEQHGAAEPVVRSETEIESSPPPRTTSRKRSRPSTDHGTQARQRASETLNICLAEVNDILMRSLYACGRGYGTCRQWKVEWARSREHECYQAYTQSLRHLR